LSLPLPLLPLELAVAASQKMKEVPQRYCWQAARHELQYRQLRSTHLGPSPRRIPFRVH
jgi:hypothetical protein